MLCRLATCALFVSALVSTLVSAACPTERSVELCCITIETFQQNAYVFEDVCGMSEPPDTVMGTGCEEVPAGWQVVTLHENLCMSAYYNLSSTFHGWYDACCESATICQSGAGGHSASIAPALMLNKVLTLVDWNGSIV
ncbi:hypothetical protein NM688_g5120 [Phlebia brevispora]|uniref:Uncharacterized protein n=1 Tax=Phlebia brevispora TaxID=194682 RepID=A0ACC1T047_9APHY|nr:hypothetical protein NM688_g5120 [Phlebia brevispora]